jgi:hypothetical protein
MSPSRGSERVAKWPPDARSGRSRRAVTLPASASATPEGSGRPVSLLGVLPAARPEEGPVGAAGDDRRTRRRRARAGSPSPSVGSTSIQTAPKRSRRWGCGSRGPRGCLRLCRFDPTRSERTRRGQPARAQPDGAGVADPARVRVRLDDPERAGTRASAQAAADREQPARGGRARCLGRPLRGSTAVRCDLGAHGLDDAVGVLDAWLDARGCQRNT